MKKAFWSIDTKSLKTICSKPRSIDRTIAEWNDASYKVSFGGKRRSTFSALASYLAFTRRNGVLENTLAGPSVAAGKTSLSWRRILLVLLAMLKSFIPSLPRFSLTASCNLKSRAPVTHKSPRPDFCTLTTRGSRKLSRNLKTLLPPSWKFGWKYFSFPLFHVFTKK